MGIGLDYKSCLECGKSFMPSQGKQGFCSPKCREKRRNGRFRVLNPKIGIASGSVGAIAELLVSADLLRRGFEVFRSVSQSCSCDLAVLLEGRLLRIEVTTGYILQSGKITHPQKDASKYDVLAIVVNGIVQYRPETFGKEKS